MDGSTAVAVLCILGGGGAAQWIAWRAKIPAIILLLALGLVLGPISGVLRPSVNFGVSLSPLIGLAVAIIVFEGGLALDFRELREAGGGVARLVLLALPVSFVLATLAAALIGKFSWPVAFVYGAIVVVTGPTVVLPMLRVARLERRATSLLKWEAIVNDPVGAILTGLILELLLTKADTRIGEFAARLAVGTLGSVALGVGAAYAIAWLFRRDQIPEVLKTPLLISVVLCLYSVSNVVLNEAGLIAATVFGVALTNQHVAGLRELRRFKEALVVLLVSALFILLAADLDPHVFSRLTWRIALLTAAMLFVVRPVAIGVATLFSDATLAERLLLAWIAPRGIIAAATAGLAGVQLTQFGYKGADLIQPTVFALIAMTVVAHGLTLKPLGRRLKLSTGDKPNLAILGASPWTTDFASVLVKHGVSTLLIDSFPGALRVARKIGVPTLQAEILSRQAEEELADNPIDYFLAATPDSIYNALVCSRLAPEVGRERVYQIATPQGHMVDPEGGMSRDWRGKIVAGQELNYEEIAKRYEAGWRFSIVDAETGAHPETVIILVVRSGGAIEFRSDDHDREKKASAGDQIVALRPPERRLP